MNPIKGVVVPVSDYGVGKTTFCLTNGYLPKDMIIINDDIKSTGIDNSMFAKYVDLTYETKGLKILEFHQYCLDLIEKLKPNKVLIWDTWTRFSNSFHPYVKKNESKFRENDLYSRGTIHGAEWWQDAHRYEGAIISELRQKFDLVFLTFHLKSLYINNVVVPGKQKPGNSKAIDQYADLRLWLTPNPLSQVPVGLVLKNIAKNTVTENGIVPQQILPLRLNECDWKHILEYYNNPIGNRLPRDDEKPSEFELSLIEGTLTPEQKRMYEVSIAYAERMENQNELEEQLLIMAEIKLRALEINAPLPVVLNKLKQEYSGIEITLEQIKKWKDE